MGMFNVYRFCEQPFSVPIFGRYLSYLGDSVCIYKEKMSHKDDDDTRLDDKRDATKNKGDAGKLKTQRR